MNASRKTAIIADGVARFAAVQDLTPADQSPAAEQVRREWAIWCDDYPQWDEFVRNVQWELFAKVNSALWPRV